MTSLRHKLLLAFSIIGLAASTMSTYVHYRLLTDASYTSFCDVNASLNCTQAYLSRFGSLWGVPVALWGVLFFAIVLFLVIGARSRSAARDAIPGYIFLMSTIGLAIVLYLAWASFFQLHTVCLFCATTYIAVIAIFILSGGALTVPVASLPRRVGADVRSLGSTPGALAVMLVVVAGIVAAIAWFPRESAAVTTEAAAFPPLTDQQRADTEKWWAVQPKVDLPIPNDGAKVLVVKFSDFMCPACRQTYEFYKPVLGKYLAAGNVRYIVKHYPLEAECNPSAPNNHYASCEAAAAVIMAKGKGTADKLEQWIFSNQIGLTPEAVKTAAKDIGGIQDFDAQYQTTLQEVKADANLGATLKVSQTPTYYINGRKLIGDTITPPQYFDYLIELALKETK